MALLILAWHWCVVTVRLMWCSYLPAFWIIRTGGEFNWILSYSYEGSLTHTPPWSWKQNSAHICTTPRVRVSSQGWTDLDLETRREVRWEAEEEEDGNIVTTTGPTSTTTPHHQGWGKPWLTISLLPPPSHPWDFPPDKNIFLLPPAQ